MDSSFIQLVKLISKDLKLHTSIIVSDLNIDLTFAIFPVFWYYSVLLFVGIKKSLLLFTVCVFLVSIFFISISDTDLNDKNLPHFLTAILYTDVMRNISVSVLTIIIIVYSSRNNQGDRGKSGIQAISWLGISQEEC